ncbi:MAG: GNAT family N-acetyltransferase [Cellulosilyticum sp.]|nr:GNAT family N-acetyltransferase [Cellulosilyticum sp.]
MVLREISSKNREDINSFIQEHWYSTEMVLRGQIVDMTTVEGIVAYEDEKIIGLLTYEIKNRECEILSLDSLVQNKGIGCRLIECVYRVAKKATCSRIKLITTNDNINAIKFYQKRGFDMLRIYRNALDISRKIKPSIPTIGDFGIPLKHEIEFEMNL